MHPLLTIGVAQQHDPIGACHPVELSSPCHLGVEEGVEVRPADVGVLAGATGPRHPAAGGEGKGPRFLCCGHDEPRQREPLHEVRVAGALDVKAVHEEYGGPRGFLMLRGCRGCVDCEDRGHRCVVNRGPIEGECRHFYCYAGGPSSLQRQKREQAVCDHCDHEPTPVLLLCFLHHVGLLSFGSAVAIIKRRSKAIRVMLLPD